MTREEYLQLFKAFTSKMLAITTAKNSDYSPAADALANFHIIEKLRPGTTACDGVFVRMSDKFMRIGNLLGKQGGAKVKDESLEDSLIDLANYSLILAILCWEASESDSRK